MGAPNMPLLGVSTVFTPFTAGFPGAYWVQPAVLAVVVLLAKLVLDYYFNSQSGLAML